MMQPVGSWQGTEHCLQLPKRWQMFMGKGSSFPSQVLLDFSETWSEAQYSCDSWWWDECRGLVLFKLRHLHGQEQPCDPSPLKLSMVLLHIPHQQPSIISPGTLIQMSALRVTPWSKTQSVLEVFSLQIYCFLLWSSPSYFFATLV